MSSRGTATRPTKSDGPDYIRSKEGRNEVIYIFDSKVEERIENRFTNFKYVNEFRNIHFYF